MPSTNVDWFRVPDFTAAALQATINAAVIAGGGIVYLPAGTYIISVSIVIPFDASNPARPITLLGDGPNATRILNEQALSGPDSLLRIERSLVAVRGLAVDGRNPSMFAPVRGIVIDGSSGPVHSVELTDIIVRRTSSHALHVVALDTPNDVRRCRYNRCTFAANGSNAAVRMESVAFDHDFQDCQVDFFGDGALDLVGCEGVVFRNGSIEAPGNVGSMTPYVRSRAARNCHLRNVWFEEPDAVTQSPWFVDLESGSNGWTISGCHFVRKTGVGGVLRAVRVGSAAGPCHGVTIINPYIRRDSTAAPMPGHIEIVNGSSECLVFGGGVRTGFGASSVQYALDVADASTKSGWIGHRRWRPPTLNTSEVGAVTTNRHLGDILVRLGQGVQAYSAKARPNPSDNAWLPLSVNRVPDEGTLNAIALSAKDSGTMVWVDIPGPGKSSLRVWNGALAIPAWNQLLVT